MFNTRIKHFYKAEPNDSLTWYHTPRAMGVITLSDAAARKGAVKCLSKIKYARHLDDSTVAAVTGSDGTDYLVMVDYVGRQMSCECQSFKHRESPCKHVVAAVANAISHQEQSIQRDAVEWMELALAEARNAALQKLPWEDKPSFSEEIAEQYDCLVASVYFARREVQGYMLPNGKLWTGPLPLPIPGERAQFHLPTGQRVLGTVIEEVLDHKVYMGYLVKLDQRPEGIASDTIEIVGAEFERTEEIIKEAKKARLQHLATEQGVSLM